MGGTGDKGGEREEEGEGECGEIVERRSSDWREKKLEVRIDIVELKVPALEKEESSVSTKVL